MRTRDTQHVNNQRDVRISEHRFTRLHRSPKENSVLRHFLPFLVATAYFAVYFPHLSTFAFAQRAAHSYTAPSARVTPPTRSPSVHITSNHISTRLPRAGTTLITNPTCDNIIILCLTSQWSYGLQLNNNMKIFIKHHRTAITSSYRAINITYLAAPQ